MSAFALLLSVLAGCISASAPDVSDTPSFPGTHGRPVIAILDSGTNAYLSIFDRPGATPDINGISYEAISIDRDQTRPIVERFRAEKPLWSGLAEGQLYHFQDTRLLAISFASFDAPPTQDGSRHGAKTSYLAARDAPDAWIVSVQVISHACDEDTSCRIHPSVAEGMEWIADQPWIDVVSISLGSLGHPPDSGTIHPEATRFIEASERAARDGKLIVNGAGNGVAPSLAEYFAGPPWIIAVGGAEPEAQGASILSSKTSDVVANMTELVPGVLTEDLEWSSGTSFATPIVAATLANALAIARASEPTRTFASSEFREALNASAVLWSDPSKWDPVPSGHGPPIVGHLNTATTPVLVQPQMGWGYVDAGLAPEIARRVLEGDLAPPPEKDQARSFQAAWQDAREEYWARGPR